MADWRYYVQEEHRNAFRDEFARIVTAKLDKLLDEACFFGTHHHYDDCLGGCDDECWGDSDERDMKENTKEFYGSLWRQTFESLKLAPVNHHRSDDEKSE